MSPLNQLLLSGFFFRLLAVIFSKGFAWSDDHFLIMEPAQNWADGYDNYWLPSPSDPNRQPQGHPLLYVWINYGILKVLMFLGINDPQSKMTFIRLLHAFWSLLIISYGYKILLKFSNERTAYLGGLALAIYWIFPFLSVRNLAEFVCVPPLLAATWYIVKDERRTKDHLIAGLFLGLAFSMRFQAVIYMAGIGIAMLITRVRFVHMLATVAVFLVIVILSQGVTDYYVWNKPFGEFLSYVEYNLNNATSYGNNVWYMYPSLILGLLIPPLSIALFAGWFYSWKRLPYIFWPAFIFLAFHTYFPNKQERFVTTILPAIIIGGAVGMQMLIEKGKFRPGTRAWNISKNFVIGLNGILLIILSVSYSKRHRCEAIYYLYNKPESVNFMIEDSNKENEFLLPPLYYLGRGRWPSVYGINKTNTPDSALVYYNNLDISDRPSHVIFWQAENINARVDSMLQRFPDMILETTIEPSIIDKTLYFLNPLNDNHTAFIYRLTDPAKSSGTNPAGREKLLIE